MVRFFRVGHIVILSLLLLTLANAQTVNNTDINITLLSPSYGVYNQDIFSFQIQTDKEDRIAELLTRAEVAAPSSN